MCSQDLVSIDLEGVKELLLKLDYSMIFLKTMFDKHDHDHDGQIDTQQFALLF